MLKILLSCLLVLSSSVQAQAYRWVDPATGKTVISDSPPPPNAKSVSKAKDPTQNVDGRSFAVQKAAEAFPVILYTAVDCLNECKLARDLLNARGVPFAEKMLQKPEDFAEVKALVGDLFIPSLKVGRQSVRGFEAASYNNLLDLAGYPSSAPPGSKPSGGLSP
mgnify:FL=1